MRRVAATVLFCTAATLAAPQTTYTSEVKPTIDLASFLFNAPFVFEGVISDEPYPGGKPVIPINVTATILGALSDTHINLFTGSVFEWPPATLVKDARVIGWGQYDNTGALTYTGNVLVIMPNGALHARVPIRLGESADRYRINSISARTPGSYARLLTHIDVHRAEHPTEWITSGDGLATARIIAVDPKRMTVGLEVAHHITNDAFSIPSVIKYTLNGRCGFNPKIHDTLLLPTFRTSADTLVVSACLDHLVLKPDGRVPSLGVSTSQLERRLDVSSQPIRIRRITK